jgi:hypothetical protein
MEKSEGYRDLEERLVEFAVIIMSPLRKGGL